MKCYKVKDWDIHFEIAQSRRCGKMLWVAIPNKHDGMGFRRIMAHARSAELFAAWVLILQVASKMSTRGVLCNERPLTAEDLHFRTGLAQEAFELAFDELVKPEYGWLEYSEIK